MGNFGQTKTNFNNITGNTIITSTKNQSVFEENYEKLLSGEAKAEAEKKQLMTMFPVTIKIPQQLHKDLTALGVACNKSVERICQEILLEACFTEQRSKPCYAASGREV